MTTRSEIERSLDDLISDECGMKFQGLAVVLAEKRWPELIASERHNINYSHVPTINLGVDIESAHSAKVIQLQPPIFDAARSQRNRTRSGSHDPCS
jgi:hypothetical protein